MLQREAGGRQGARLDNNTIAVFTCHRTLNRVCRNLASALTSRLEIMANAMRICRDSPPSVSINLSGTRDYWPLPRMYMTWDVGLAPARI